MAVQELRAADSDRERVVERLRRANDEGRIDLFEFDERVAAAYAARTYADLAPLTADLPELGTPPIGSPGRARAVPPPGATRSPLPSARRSRRSRRDGWASARRIQLLCWLFAGVVNVVIWAAVSVGVGGGVYPWWVWVVGPWGFVLLLEQLTSKARPCH
ncbi:MAG: hypothetical protein QOK26_3445 [Pseudonocardiales bacterium]|nr:hypothetical protein [Pseudonocardiales bacterium]